MKYLTIAPSYTQSCIRDDFNGPIELESLSLPKDFIEEINSWHLQYRMIIPLNEHQRKEQMKTIEILDKQGLKIAEKIKILLNAKVRYFSEGKLKYLEK